MTYIVKKLFTTIFNAKTLVKENRTEKYLYFNFNLILIYLKFKKKLIVSIVDFTTAVEGRSFTYKIC